MGEAGKTRRHLLLAAPLLAGAAVAGKASAQGQPAPPAPSGAADALAAQAAGLGPVIWYESSPPDQSEKVVAAFRRRYPGVQVRHVRDTGGNAMSARIIQESQANARTADIGTNSASIVWPLVRRDLVESVDWAALGADPRLAPTPYTLLTTAATYVLLSNTQQVTEADAPKTWDALLDPRWRGKIGVWVRTEPFVSLAAAWGADRTAEYLQRLAAQQPLLFPSAFPLAQQLAAGEVAVAVGTLHATQPALARGAPIRLVVADPVPISSLFSFVTRTGRNRPGGQLLALWLATDEGAKAYEDATGRGNPLVAGTRTAQLLQGRTITEQRPEDADTTLALVERYNAILAQGGGREASRG